MIRVSILQVAGNFAENKDVAKALRNQTLRPALETNENEIIIDFTGVSGATQSFIHALISQLIREYGDELFTRIIFKGCNSTVEEVVNIVAEYMSES